MQKIIIKGLVAICLYLLVFTVIAGTQIELNDYQKHSDISSTAEKFVSAEIGKQDDSISVQIKSLDKRLRLNQCAIPLVAFWPPGASHTGHTSVGIRCTDNKPWKIYVGATIKQFRHVWVSDTAIARGTIISNAHITLEKREISFIHSEYFDGRRSPIGLMAKRPIRKGDIIQALALEKPMAVKRGDRVVVVARINGLEVRTAATALSSAAEGDQIRVRNISSNKELVGTLHENSVVHVNI